jgi:translation initiation factor IF-3
MGDEWPRKVEAAEKSKVASNDFVTAGHPAKVVAARDGRQRRRSAVGRRARDAVLANGDRVYKLETRNRTEGSCIKRKEPKRFDINLWLPITHTSVPYL